MVDNKSMSKSKKLVSKSNKSMSKSKKKVSKSMSKSNKNCPNMPKRKATGWSKVKVEGKDMLVKTCCRGCAVAIEKKLKDDKMKKKDLVLLPFSDAKKLVDGGEKVRDVKVGGIYGACSDKSLKTKKTNVKKCDDCGCGGNKRRTHKAQKGGAVRAGTVVQNMPVREGGGDRK